MTDAQNTVAALMALRHYVAGERVRLARKFNHEIVSTSDIACVEELEFKLWVLTNHLVSCTHLSRASFGIDYESELPAETLTVKFNAAEVAEVVMTGAKVDVLAEIADQINDWFALNTLDGKAFVTLSEEVVILGPVSYTETVVITYEVTDVNALYTAELTNIQSFCKGAEIGTIKLRCDCEQDLQGLLDKLSSEFLWNTKCDPVPPGLAVILSDCEECCSDIPPVAVLAASFTSDPLSLLLDATDSLRCNEVPIDPDDEGGNVVMIWDWVDYADPDNPILLSRCEILPGSDASDAGSWTYIEGTKTELQFQTQLLPAITGTGAFHSVLFSAQSFFSYNEETIIRLWVRDELCGTSQPVYQLFSVEVVPVVFFRGNATLNFSVQGSGQMIVEWNDGSGSTTYNLPAVVSKVLGTQTGLNEISFLDPNSITEIDLSSNGITEISFVANFINHTNLLVDLFNNDLDGVDFQETIDHLTAVLQQVNVGLVFNLAQNKTTPLTDAEVTQINAIINAGYADIIIDAFEVESEMTL